jgi:hypothetical protein
MTMEEQISILGLDKAEVLQALFNASKQQGMGFMDKTGAVPMSLDEARQELKSNTYGRFDYLRGRVMKIDLSGDSFNPRLYDRDNGQGAAARALKPLLDKQTA